MTEEPAIAKEARNEPTEQPAVVQASDEPTEQPAIEASNLTKDLVSSFLRKKTRVLDNLNLKIQAGQTFGLLGPNGAGKTTTLKILLGLMRPTHGQALVLGAAAGDARALARVGFLPENPYFYSYLTGREFMDFIASLFALSMAERKVRCAELLETVSLSRADADKPLHKYSKGMLQRLGIAQSLINDPDILFWDEPMSGLDPIGRRDVRAILTRLKEQKKTIFFSSHLLPDVNEVCDQVGILNHGKLVALEKVSVISSSGNYRELEEYFLQAVTKTQASNGHDSTLSN